MDIQNSKLEENEILNLLLRVDPFFKPTPLSVRVDLRIYAKKLATHAAHFFVRDNERLIGMICCYINDVNKTKAFVSNISIDPDYIGKGIGLMLSMECENAALKMGFKSIESEVHINNIPSLKMYLKLGYQIDRNLDDNHYIMRKFL